VPESKRGVNCENHGVPGVRLLLPHLDAVLVHVAPPHQARLDGGVGVVLLDGGAQVAVESNV